MSGRTDRAVYVDHASLLEANGSAAKRLMALLAPHMADEAVRMGAAGDIMLAGGGSLIPGMADALGGALGAGIVTVDDPVMSNAAGFEAKAAAFADRLAKIESPQ